MCSAGWRNNDTGESCCLRVTRLTVQISDFYTQLFHGIPRDRFATLSCAHVIPKSNLLTQVVCRGPRKQDFEFKFASRGDDALVCCEQASGLALTAARRPGIRHSILNRDGPGRRGRLSPLVFVPRQGQSGVGCFWTTEAAGREEASLLRAADVWRCRDDLAGLRFGYIFGALRWLRSGAVFTSGSSRRSGRQWSKQAHGCLALRCGRREAV